MFLRRLFSEAVGAVQPRDLVRASLRLVGNELRVEDATRVATHDLGGGRVFVVGFGKGVLPLAAEVESVLGATRISRGVLSVPRGFPATALASDTRLVVREGAAGNLPDAAAVETARLIDELVQGGGREGDDLLLVLITGGGSALLPFPRPPITLDEKADLVRDLSLAGAPIKELNAVRKRISELKGGRLALKATRSGFRVMGLIISDVVGDPLGLIASGPTVLNGDDPSLAKEIIERYNIPIPSSVTAVLSEECETQSPSQFENVQNFIIGNNDIALNRMFQFAASESFSAFIASNRVEGEARAVAAEMAARAKAALEQGSGPSGMPLCLISGGEPVVNVRGGGVGGRNLELALAFALEAERIISASLRQKYEIGFLSAGTDGIDGPTDVAGAIVDASSLVEAAASQHLDPLAFLTDNDSYTFFEKFNDGQSLIRCGHTGTNVMDVQAITIQKRRGKC